ncbi:MAG TPA: site-2 protease family protein [Terriglobales bacterium]|nr:site-2 protease family protein [Terriglobales bacterium]
MSEPLPPTASLPELPRFPHEVIFVPPPRPRRRIWLHLLLFLATTFTTLIVGARLQHNFNRNRPAYSEEEDFFPVTWALSEPSRLLMGTPFSVTLLLILLAHEMGHFVFCVRNRVYATLPFFIPAPTIIGTFGAFIRIRSPIRTRTALFDIGIAGPIAGFLVAVPALALGMMLSRDAPQVVSQSELQFGYPAIFDLLWAVLPLSDLQGGSSLLRDIYFHPIAVAAWVGMFATALNLIPGGQLDGGHIVYALSPRLHRNLSRLVAALLIPMSYYWWTGWLLWALILLITGTRHPQVQEFPELSPGRKRLARFGLLILLLTFIPAPFAGGSLRELLFAPPGG